MKCSGIILAIFCTAHPLDVYAQLIPTGDQRSAVIAAGLFPTPGDGSIPSGQEIREMPSAPFADFDVDSVEQVLSSSGSVALQARSVHDSSFSPTRIEIESTTSIMANVTEPDLVGQASASSSFIVAFRPQITAFYEYSYSLNGVGSEMVFFEVATNQTIEHAFVDLGNSFAQNSSVLQLMAGTEYMIIADVFAGHVISSSPSFKNLSRGMDIVLQRVPEPSSTVLVAIAATMLSMRSRKRIVSRGRAATA